MKYFSTREEKFCISKQPCNVLFIIFISTNEIPNHFTLISFCCERHDLLCSHYNSDLFTCGDNMLFSCVKISCFHGKAHLVFHWCLYNKGPYFMLVTLSTTDKHETDSVLIILPPPPPPPPPSISAPFKGI